MRAKIDNNQLLKRTTSNDCATLGFGMAGARHHWVPQFYQRRFISDGSGLVLDSEPRQESIRKTAMARDFYAFTKNEARDSRSVEDALQKIDHMGPRLMRKVDHGERLTDQQRYELSVFVSVMWRRTAQHKEEAEQRAAAMMPGFFDQHNEDWLVSRLEEKQVAPDGGEVPFQKQRAKLAAIRSEYMATVPDFLFARNVVRPSIFEQVMYLMDWGFFRCSDAQEFITSDNPVVFSKGKGLKHDDAVIFFPLSRNTCLQAMWKSQYEDSYVRASTAQVGLINRYMAQNAKREVYASYKSAVLAEFVSKWVDTFDSPIERIRHYGRPRRKARPIQLR
ncbi:hypothetical protein BH18ACI4_BH18ACI4_14010 [soil metagenome]